ncbi:signal peptidase I [bacterium]|nr:signal peptidase I [bacterium]
MEEVDEEKDKKGSQKNPVREGIEIIIFAVILALFIRTYVVQAFKIPTGSMERTLLIGDHILVNKFVFSPVPSFLKFILPVREPKRGDITVFKFPEDMSKDFVKRMIGMPNENIHIRNKKVFVNDERIEYPGKERFFRNTPWDNYGPVTIPPNNYFMMGDNRDNSHDSRGWGFLDRNLIKGRVLFVYFSVTQNWEMKAYEGKKTFLKSLLNRIRWSRFLKMIS